MLSRLALLGLLLCHVVAADRWHNDYRGATSAKTEKYEDGQHWLAEVQDEIDGALRLKPITTRAKNVIIFIGDGMSLPTVTGARIYQAQRQGSKWGEESSLTMDTLPHFALSKTFATDAQTTDSAASAFAIYSGVKTNHYTMGYDSSVIKGNATHNATAYDTIYKWAQDAGKDTGFVTTTRLSHATPAALYAQTPHRDWECDSKTPKEFYRKDISHQLIHTSPGNKSKVMLGGGIRSFIPESKKEQYFPTNKKNLKFDYDTDDWDCWRNDTLDLISDFLNRSKTHTEYENTVAKLVKNKKELMDLDVENTDYLMGLFHETFMSYEDARDAESETGEPSLVEMTEVAVKMLSKNKDHGFFLMVEGGNIDHAHHGSRAQQALNEAWMLDQAVNKTLSMVNLDETLVIVTADHGHTMSIAGYQTRGADIRGTVDNQDGDDGKPYMILAYAQGKGFYHNLQGDGKHNVSRMNPDNLNFTDFQYNYPSSAPLDSETHSGADVGIFAKGPWAHLFHGVRNENYISYVMAYASCVGPFKDREDCDVTSAAPGLSHMTFYILVSALCLKQILFSSSR